MNVTRLIWIVAGCTLVAACGWPMEARRPKYRDGRAIMIDTDVCSTTSWPSRICLDV